MKDISSISERAFIFYKLKFVTEIVSRSTVQLGARGNFSRFWTVAKGEKNATSLRLSSTESGNNPPEINDGINLEREPPM